MNDLPITRKDIELDVSAAKMAKRATAINESQAKFDRADKTIDLLCTFDENYIPPFRVMLHSLVVNNPGEKFRIWLLHSVIPESKLEELSQYCEQHGVELKPLVFDRELFEHAPVSEQYPQEMYYRLLASKVLPESLDRILYLDPDTLVINAIRPLWETDLGTFTFAAAFHNWGPFVLSRVNRDRLDLDTAYYNTGVILMDLEKARKLIDPEEIFEYVKVHSEELRLPDQDLFNVLYGKKTKSVDDRVWNYDVRYFYAYYMRSEGVCTTEWIVNNTVILHFCGKSKPWNNPDANRFGLLYQHYMRQA